MQIRNCRTQIELDTGNPSLLNITIDSSEQFSAIARGATAGNLLYSVEGTSQMTLQNLIILLIIAGVCGALGQAISGFTRGGCLASIALGFIGALIGPWLAHLVGLHELFAVNIGGTTFPIIWSIIGSAIFVALLGLLSRGRR